MSKKNLSANHHMIEGYSERITTKEWKEILLNEEDKVVFHATVRRLVAKRLGYGVVEISKEALAEVKEKSNE